MSQVTIEYQKKWHHDASMAERLRWQQRAFETFENLFNRIIKASFAGKILDVGCGDGALVNLLNSKKNITAVGIDINHGIDFERDRLPFGDGEFNIVLMYSVIEHLFDPGNILKEIRRILKTDGFLVMITPQFDLAHPLISDLHFYEDPTHVHPYNSVSLAKLMSLYNLRKAFIGLWTVKKPFWLWRLPAGWQFYLGALLPFTGQTQWAPQFLKGRSKSLLGVFQK